MTRPVSVVVPVHAGERYIAETIESLLAQTVAPAEIIVVDDASPDRSIEIARSIDGPIRVVEAGERDPERARAVGVGAAANEVVAFCDADDLWTPNKLALQLAAVADLTGPFLVWGGVEEFVSPELAPGEYTGRPPHGDLGRARLPSALVTTRSTCAMGRPTLAECDHWVAWIAGLPDTVPVRWVDDVVLRRRLHRWHHSSVNTTSVGSWLAAARARAQRARGDSAP